MANLYDSIPTRVNNTVIDASWFNTIKTTLVNNGSVKHNKSATTAPTTSNDDSENYEPGSTWADTTNDKFYYCIDASTGAAVWFEFANTTGTQTFTNKRLDSPKINEDVAMTSTATELNQLDGVSVGGNSSGDIITTDDTQTLTNKTLTTPQVNEAVNLTSTSSELNQLDGVSVGGNSSGDIITTDDTQTLTNKILTSPGINGANQNMGSASNSNRIILPSETTTNLDALTDTAGLLAYDTILSKVVYNNGSGWVSLAVPGASSLDNILSKSTTYTATTSDDIIKCDSSGGAFTITLYAASGNSGRKIKFIKTSSDFNPITIDGNASETINGNTTTTINTQYEELELVCDGSNWLIVNRKCDTAWAAYTPSLTNLTLGNGTLEFYWRRSGDCEEVYGFFEMGSSSVMGTSPSFAMVSGTTSDSSKYNSLQTLGSVHLTDNSTASNNTGGTLRASGAILYVFLEGGTVINASSPFSWFTNDEISFYATIPVSGWKGANE
jgi:hypothetical protein